MEDQYQRIVTAEPGQIIYLGYQGENLARKIVFDVSAFQKTYPEGRIELLAQRKGDALPYPAARTILDGEHLIWILTDADTAKKEYGKCELCCHVNGKLAKTEVWTTFTMPALCTAAESPESSAQTQHLPKIGENRTWWIWDERSEAYIDSGIPVSSTANSLGELSDPAKRALLTLAQKVAYVDEHGQDYYDALYAALYPPAELLTITASFAQGSHVVYDTDSLDSLKPYLTVTGAYDDDTRRTITSYTLSGTLTEGVSTITVTAGGKTAAFTVNVTHKVAQVTGISAVFTQGSAVIYDNASLDDLKPYLVVTASYDDGTSAAVSGYTLSGTLTAGTSTITANYGGFSDTFTVTVTERPVTLISITAVFTQGQNVIHDTDSLDTLKQYLVVTAHYDDNTDTVVSDYTLSGTLTEGTSTITANYGGQSDTFNVTVTHAASEHTVVFSDVIDETLNDKYFDGHTFEPTVSRTGMRVSTYIPVTEGTSITFANGFKYPNLNAVDMVFYDSGKTILSSDNATYGKKVFTVPAGASCFRFADDVSNANNTITSFY